MVEILLDPENQHLPEYSWSLSDDIEMEATKMTDSSESVVINVYLIEIKFKLTVSSIVSFETGICYNEFYAWYAITKFTDDPLANNLL